MTSKAETIEEYIAELPPERREPIQVVVDLVRANIPEGYVEAMTWGMPGWEIPLSTYPNTYNKKPLMYAALASQKNHMALYLTAPYGNNGLRQKLEDGFAAAGKKLDMGGSCLRFKKLEALEMGVIAEVIRAVTVEKYISFYEAAQAQRKSK